MLQLPPEIEHEMVYIPEWDHLNFDVETQNNRKSNKEEDTHTFPDMLLA
jgi:hypothetical protein